MDEERRMFQTVKLFRGIGNDELDAVLGCLNAQRRTFHKGELLLAAGEPPRYVGIVLSGQLHIVKDDIDGNRSLSAVLEAGDIFGEALCCAGVTVSPVSVIAGANADVLLLEFSRILTTCPKSCSHHRQLIANMLRLVAQKNLYLQNRMQLICIKSIRAKVLRYLDGFATKRGASFSVPLSREEMADYLGVDRSALSHELIRMKQDKLIDYHRNTFKLLE